MICLLQKENADLKCINKSSFKIMGKNCSNLFDINQFLLKYCVQLEEPGSFTVELVQKMAGSKHRLSLGSFTEVENGFSDLNGISNYKVLLMS